MGSMLQVLDVPQMQLADILSIQARTQQVKTAGHRHGKMYASKIKMMVARQRFIDFHNWCIDTVNERSGNILMNSGIVVSFHAFETYEDVYNISGIQFCMVDVDLDLSDRRTLDFIKMRLRCPH